MTINTRISNRVGRQRDPSLIFQAVAGYATALFRDNVSGTNFTQAYAGTNRTITTAAGLNAAVAANTVPIDHIGASLEPALRLEPAAANLLFSTRTFTTAAGWTFDGITTAKNQVGVDGVANSGTTLTDANAAAYALLYRAISITNSPAPYTFQLFIKKTTGATTYPLIVLNSGGDKGVVVDTNNGVLYDLSGIGPPSKGIIDTGGDYWFVWIIRQSAAATISAYVYSAGAIALDGSTSATAVGSCVIDAAMLTTGSIPSSYFDGAAAIGAELVTDGGFDAVTEGAAVNSGLLTIGNCYKIALRTDGDFIAAGSPDNVAGTYFNATTTGVGLLDAGDTVNPITFTSWTAGVGWAPQATAGALTGKAQKIAGTASALSQTTAEAEAANVYRVGHTAVRTAGTYTAEFGSTNGTAIAANGLYYDYIIAADTDYIKFNADASFAGSIDLATGKKHGTVRLSEANTTTLAIPADVAAALAATGTIVIKGRFAFARAAGVVTNILASAAATASLVYTTTTAGNITSNDGTTIAENTGAYTANTDWKIALKFPSDTDKYRIGIDVAGAGIAWGAEVAFDGAFTATANLILGYVLHGPTWIYWIKTTDKVLTDAQIDAM